MQFVALNGSGSKLDAFLDRSLTYEVGRCVDEQGQVKSTVTVDLTNDIPLGERPPEYMVSLAKEGPTGPVNVVLRADAPPERRGDRGSQTRWEVGELLAVR